MLPVNSGQPQLEFRMQIAEFGIKYKQPLQFKIPVKEHCKDTNLLWMNCLSFLNLCYKLFYMKITPLPFGEKPAHKFKPLPGTGRSFSFSTFKFEVEVIFATANFYAPEFYHVIAKNKAGETIWSGKESLFVDYLFSQEFISDAFSKLILQRIDDTNQPASGHLILVNLEDGTEQEIGSKGAYGHSGHFQSFDGIFYTINGVTYCINFETGKTYELNPIIGKLSGVIKSWWPCPVKNCIVLWNSNEKKLSLFDLSTETIVDQCPLLLETADSVNLNFSIHPALPVLQVSVDYASRNSSGILQFLKTDYFTIEF